MPQGCSKFRVFGVLVFLVLVNIVIFRTDFYRLDTLWVSVRHDVNSTSWHSTASQDMTSQRKTTSQDETTSVGIMTSRGKTTFVVTSAKDFITTSPSPVLTPVQQTTVQTTTPVQQTTVQTTTPVQQTTVQTTTPVQQTTIQTTTPVQQTTIQTTTPVQQATVQTTTPVQQTTIQTTTPVQQTTVQTTTPVQQTTIQTTKSDRGCHKITLEAYGKTVKHRADVKPPWKKGDNSTLCPPVPPKLVGKLATYQQAPNWTELAATYPELEPGGYYHPPDCKPRHRVAVIVPYRARETHLRILLNNLHPMLMRQQLDYFILVVELAMPTQFNRGMLLNIGAVEALGLWDVQCFIFHDVDLLPENDRNLYTCPEMPRHMSVAVDKFNYKPLHAKIFGGVSAVSCEHLYKVNGYSNTYFGWGGEDDDLCERLISAGLKIIRYPVDIARYRMIKHQRDKKNEPNPQRFKLLNEFKQRMATDGLNSLQYQVQKVEFRPTYTWMLVSIDQDKILKTKELTKSAPRLRP